MKITLAEERNGQRGAERSFDQPTVKVGRDPRVCQIVFDQSEWPMVSRLHAEFRFQTGRYMIADTNSSNGTFVDGRRIIEPVEVRPGMRVQFGAGGPVLRILNTELEPVDTRHVTIGDLETYDQDAPAKQLDETVFASTRGTETSPSKASGIYCPNCGNMLHRDERFCRQCGASNPSRGQMPGTASYPDTTMAHPPRIAVGSPAAGASEQTGSFDNRASTVSSKPPAGVLPQGAPAAYQSSPGAAKPTADSALEAVRDVVRATVYAPPAAAQGDAFLVQVFAHLRDQEAQADEFARQFDAAARQRGYGTLKERVTRGSKLAVHLIMPGLEVDEPVQELMWDGTPESVQFSVRVPVDRQTCNVIGTVIISCEGNPIGHVKFTLAVVSAAERNRLANNQRQTVGDWKRYGKAFVSYASQDRQEVLKRVQMLSRLRIEYFQDVLDLEPGQRWEQQLYRHIDESDLFLLFWSSAAKRSQWVLKEVQYALKRKDADELDRPEIMPVIIEGPPPVEPPPELSHIHFNDYLLYFMNAPKRGTWWETLKRWMGIS